MTKSSWPSDKGVNYESEVHLESQSVPGVRFTIARMSFGRRIELTKQVRELTRRIEFLEAGNEAGERIEAALASSEVDHLYLRWGLSGLEGLEIDGQPATPEGLIAKGPEKLCREILGAIRAECGLTEEERKN